MPVTINRKSSLFEPDASRVIARFMQLNDERSTDLLSQIMHLPELKQQQLLRQVLRDYAQRHRSVARVFEKHFNRLRYLLERMDIDPNKLSTTLKILIGSYFTMEYSIEAAAFFNPSIVEDLDQSDLGRDEKRVIISFRATGEGHVSSIVFRSGVIDANNNIQITAPGKMLESPEHIKKHIYHKTSFLQKLREMQDFSNLSYDALMNKLTPTFTYEELKRYVSETRVLANNDPRTLLLLDEIMWLASSHYEMDFSLDTDISERVIFPIADTEIKGIEDARFVRFVEDNGEVVYYATYTAYDGITILPKLLRTKDFYHFKVMPIHGKLAQNKGMALFPRKVNGKFAMLCRTDGVNNYISFSENINVWQEATLLQAPEYPWELIQTGNCGSPIETTEGWLVITHGVGPVREYTLSASLLDLNNPAQVIGRLPEPMLVPDAREREGYVPNVLYSCGSMIHNNELIIPYAMSDYSSTYATINLSELLDALKQAGNH